MAPEQRGTAFGIEVHASFPIPELPLSRNPRSDNPSSRLTHVSVRDLERAWPTTGAETVLRRALPDGRTVMVISRHDVAGFQVWGPRYGRHHVSPDGTTVSCALPRIAAWRWERLLFAQVLPLAAALRGRELFHSSAVTVGGGTVAFVGSSGAGKSSIAAHLVARGATLVTDDVLALARHGQRVIAYPGAAFSGVERGELASMTSSGRARLGRRIGNTHKAYLATPVADKPTPLRAVYFLARGSGTSIEVTRSDSMAMHLLSSSFISYLDVPQQLVQHLDVCAHIAATVPTLEVSSPASVRASDVAATVEAHAATLPEVAA